MIKVALSILFVVVNTMVVLRNDGRVGTLFKCFVFMTIAYAGCFSLLYYFGSSLFSSPEVYVFLATFGASPLLMTALSRLSGIVGDLNDDLQMLKFIFINYLSFIGGTIYQLMLIWTDVLSNMIITAAH